MFSQVFILKVVKVLCFDTLLQVFILKGLTLHKNCATGEHSCEGGSSGSKSAELDDSKGLPKSPFDKRVRKSLILKGPINAQVRPIAKECASASREKS